TSTNHRCSARRWFAEPPSRHQGRDFRETLVSPTDTGYLARNANAESMPKPLMLHPDRLFPAEPAVRAVARELYESVKALPIVSPHGHTDPRWFATDEPWTNATELLLAPDHYLYRMLYSQGVSLEALGVPDCSGASNADPREAWRPLASNYYLFRGTPS